MPHFLISRAKRMRVSLVPKLFLLAIVSIIAFPLGAQAHMYSIIPNEFNVAQGKEHTVISSFTMHPMETQYSLQYFVHAFQAMGGYDLSKAHFSGTLVYNDGSRSEPLTFEEYDNPDTTYMEQIGCENTADGYERSLQVNYIAPKLITERLMPHIAKGGKVINTLSCTIKNGNFVPLQKDITKDSRRESTISSLKHYSDAKYMMALFTINLALEHKDITVCAADPGIVNTGIITMHRWYDPLADIFFRPFIKSSAQGARPIINAVGFTGTNGNGKVLFFKGNKITGLDRKFYAAAGMEKEITIL